MIRNYCTDVIESVIKAEIPKATVKWLAKAESGYEIEVCKGTGIPFRYTLAHGVSIREIRIMVIHHFWRLNNASINYRKRSKGDDLRRT